MKNTSRSNQILPVFQTASRIAAAFLTLLLLCLCSKPAAAADVAYYGIFKYQTFQQTNASAPSLDAAMQPHGFSAGIQTPGLFQGQVMDATLQLPNGSVEFLMPPPDGTLYWTGWRTNSVASNALATAYPPGNYKLSFTTDNDGQRSITLALPASSFPSAAPYITNWTEAQAIDPAKPFTLRWNPIPGATADDLIFLGVGPFRTANYAGEPGFITLNGTNTSVVIPAYSLPVEAAFALPSYVAVERDVVINTASYPGAVGYVGFGRQTFFSVGTLPAPLAQPVTNGIVRSNQQAVVHWTGGLGSVQVQKRTNLATSAWLDFQSSTTSTNATDPAPGTNSFYRLRFLPPAIGAQSLGGTLVAGSNLMLSVTATGTEPILYQWQLDGFDLHQSTSPTLLRTYVTTNDSGSYRVILSNRVGAVTSSVVVVTVTNPPVPFAGIFTGKFAGQSDNGGYAVLVWNDRTAVVVGYNTPQDEGVFAGGFSVSRGGKSAFFTAQGGRVTGTFTASTVSGTFTNSLGVGGSFTGTKRPATGIQQAAAGYYTGTYSGLLNGNASVILAADGTVFFFSSDSTGDGGGFGTINAANQVSVTSVAGTIITGTLNPATFSISGNYNSPGVGGGTYSVTRQP